ncbi:HAD hydrolase-like protein [uncultured Ilyobacter sp.]|uniref:HAD hydrolase-like protein n=1 Tax=uncultured Ilyobacter sp. TaxID=544433 RepID=UPI0029C99F6D|nr:HAD hydrolase-like protein [uncultured Ilyobacter sp.]
MKKFDLVIFDLDGTLTDSREGITRSISHALSEMGLKAPPLQELEHFIGPPLMDSFMDYYKFSKSDSEKAVKLFRERYSEKGLYENVPFHNINTLLSALKNAGIRLAVATSKPQHFSENILDHFLLSQYFDEIIGSSLDNSFSHKNQIITETLKRFSEIPKEKIVMVGDRKFDIDGARENGISSIGVKYGFADPGEIDTASPDFQADNVEDLFKILL